MAHEALKNQLRNYSFPHNHRNVKLKELKHMMNELNIELELINNTMNLIGQNVPKYFCMSNILLYTNDLELGTKLSEQLLYGNNKIRFIDNFNELNNDANMLIIDLDSDDIKPNIISMILENYSSIRIVGIMRQMKKQIWNDFRDAGCEMIYLHSVLVKNIELFYQMII